MSILYSATTGGFYIAAVHGKSIPSDARPVQSTNHAELLAAQPNGRRIQPGDSGAPIAVELASVHAVPAVCSPAQGLVALFALKGVTEEFVLHAIEAIPDEVQRYTARIGYQRATTWERNSPTMQTMAQLLQLSGSDLDALFAYATTVKV